MSAKAKAIGRYACPLSGEPLECPECEAAFPHVREEGLRKGQKIPSCEEHKVKLVRA